MRKFFRLSHSQHPSSKRRKPRTEELPLRRFGEKLITSLMEKEETVSRAFQL